MSGNLCEHCSGMCCRYIALPIETPDTRADFDDIRWYLMHRNVSVFVEDGEWYIYFATDCRHLQPDFRCGAYETRPRICREYSSDNCDYHSGKYGWEHHFLFPEHLDEYVREHFGRGKRRGKGTAGGRRNGDTRGAARGGPRVRRGGRPVRPEGRTTDAAGVPLPMLEDPS